MVGKNGQGAGGELEEEERRGNAEGEMGGRGGDRGEGGRREDSPVSSPSSGYNSSGPGGNSEVGGREDGQQEDRLERGGMEEQLLIDLSSPGGEEGTPATWDGVKLVLPKSNSQEQSQTFVSGAVTGNVRHTQRYESGQQRDMSRYTVANHSTHHCCHHTSCHTSRRHQRSQKRDEEQVKACQMIGQQPTSGLWADCQGGQSQPKQPTNQCQKNGARMDGGISTSPGSANERQDSGGIQNSSLKRSQDGRSEKESRSSRQVGPSPNRSTCSPSPSRRPGWTDFSDDEDLNFTRWQSI